MPSSTLFFQDLHHPAMRDRHWTLLMQTTGKHFVMDDKFCLGDLLALELHNFVDACQEIVDRAQKELNIEKQLKKIEDTWAGLNLSFAPYQVGSRVCHSPNWIYSLNPLKCSKFLMYNLPMYPKWDLTFILHSTPL